MNALIIILLVLFICIAGLIIGGPFGLLIAIAACIVVIPIISIFAGLLKELICGLFNLLLSKNSGVSASDFECSACGKDVNQDDKFCPHCGVSLLPPNKS